MEVGRHFFLLSSILLLLFPCFIEAKKCAAADGACHPYSKFMDIYHKVNLGTKTTEECKDGSDACAVFWCLIDGKKVMVGLGCYSDYVSICGFVSNNAIIDVKKFDKGMTESKEELGTNARVYACIDGENCAADKYKTLEGSGLWTYYENQFAQGADKTYDESCEYPRTSSSSIGMKQINGFKLFGMIFLCFFLAQFW